MKIGVLTHYYNTHNYGGILQAYALVKFLRINGYDAEQICYELDLKSFVPVNKAKEDVKIKITLCQRIIRSINYRYRYYIKEPLESLIYEKYKRKYLSCRYSRFLEFQNLIPHSKEVYTTQSISNTLTEYDCFIVGSDQVWNLDWYSPVFYLEFADKTKKKIAYAASAGRSEFNEKEIEHLRKVLPMFDAISVREENLVNVYKSLVEGVCPKFVVDPVFLLDLKEWDKISKKRLIKDKYVFSFFLGCDDKMKNLAHKYAKKKKLKLVTIPFCVAFNSMDITYGNKRINIAGPEDFISLIKYSECVFTDSFHATAFSIIYRKSFFVFERKSLDKMSPRIESLTKLAGCEDSFCDTENRCKMQYILNKGQNDFSSIKSLTTLQRESKNFLVSSMNE